MQSTTARLMLALLMGVCLALVGCESDDDGGDVSSQGDSSVNVTGTWDVNVQNADGSTRSLTLTLTQAGTAVSGTAVNNVQGGSGTVTGSVSGNAVTLTLSGEGTYGLVGTVSGNTMTGTGGQGSDRSSTFTATRR